MDHSFQGFPGACTFHPHELFSWTLEARGQLAGAMTGCGVDVDNVDKLDAERGNPT